MSVKQIIYAAVPSGEVRSSRRVFKASPLAATCSGRPGCAVRSTRMDASVASACDELWTPSARHWPDELTCEGQG